MKQLVITRSYIPGELIREYKKGNTDMVEVQWTNIASRRPLKKCFKKSNVIDIVPAKRGVFNEIILKYFTKSTK